MKKSTNIKLFSSILIPFLLHISVYCQDWQIVTTKYETKDVIVAGFVADAITYGNGVTDATAYLQELLNNLDKCSGDPNHGGGVLYLPEGMYKVEGTLVIPKGITLRGDWQKPVKGQPIKGTVLMAYSGKGDADETPFITMEPAAAVMDLVIWYPEQNPYNITPYPHTIQFGRPNYFGNEFCNVKNITLVNSYSGIYCFQGGGTCPTINGVYGTPLKQGIEIDRIVDVGRIEHCDFSPAYWAGSGFEGAPSLSNDSFIKWIYNNGVGVVMRRNDWSYTCYLKVEGYNKGFYATQSLQADNGSYSTPNGHNYGFNLKNCKYGLYFEGRAGEGCMFTEVKTEGCKYGAYIASNAAGVLQLYKWNITADAADFAIFSDKTAATKIIFQESTVNSGKVRLQGGTFIAMDNDFNNDAPQIEFEVNSRGNILGNRFKDNNPQIIQNSVFENQINHEPVVVKKIPEYVEFVPHSKKPTRNVMYNVLDYGVQKGTINSIPDADATQGIQAALNDAQKDGGGVVYLPPGHYRINGSLTIPSNVELKGSVDVSAFPLGPGSILEIYCTTENAVKMQKGSGLRGVVFNYPEQVLCTVMPQPIEYPYAIQVQGNDVYIINVGMRAAFRGVDLFSYPCDNFYIDFLTGHFFKEGVNIKNSKNGILANMQCNTIVYNCGDESKFGGFPNSNRPECSEDESKDPYLYNSRNLNFLTMENVEGIFLYNDFNYNTLNGIVFKDNVSGTAVGFALDDDRTGLLVDGSNVNFDFVNLQNVALQRGTVADGKSSYIKTTNNFISGSLNVFNSDYWGYASSSGIVMDGAGTVSLQSTNFMHSGVESFARVNGGKLEINASVVNDANNNNPLYNGDGLDGIFTQGSLLDPVGTSTSRLGSWTHNLSMKAVPSAESALDRSGWVATASYSSDGSTPQQGIDGNATSRWTSGWQNQGEGQEIVWYQVDMGSLVSFNQIILEYTDSPNDGPQTYVLEVSIDGKSWIQVASGESSPQMTIISFEEQTARYFRITKPKSTKANYWAIHELYVFDVVAAKATENTPYGGNPALIPGVIEAENYDLGGQDLAYSDSTPENEGGQYRTVDGVDIEICQNGGYNVCSDAGEWIKYMVNVASGGNYTFEAVVASESSGFFYVTFDDVDVTGMQTVATGGWQIWDTIKVTNMQLTIGMHEMVFHCQGGMNLDKFLFSKELPPYGGSPFNGPHDIYDGAILEAEDFDNGGEGVAYHDQEAGHQNPGQSIVYRPDEDVEVESYVEGEYNIGFTNNGEWTNYSVNVTTSGKYDIGVVVASGNDNGRFKLLLDNSNISGDISFANTGGWSSWDTIIVPNITLTQGSHIFTWYTYGGMNLDKFIFNFVKKDTYDDLGINLSDKLTVYPNPSEGVFFIKNENIKKGKMLVTNAKGVKINEGQLKLGYNKIDLRAYPLGIYLVKIIIGCEVKSFKLIKK